MELKTWVDRHVIGLLGAICACLVSHARKVYVQFSF